MITSENIKEFVCQAHRVGEAGLTICSSGNLSWRIGDEALVSGTGSWVPSLKEENVSVLKVATGEVVNGVKPSMESVFHLGVMRNREDVNVVLHFQSQYATLLACSEDRPKNINVTAEMPLHVGRVIPEIPFYRPGSPELANAVVDALKNRNSIQLLKHGQVVCGKDFDDVFQRAMFFEMGCRIVYQALQAGTKPSVLSEEELDALEMHFLGHTTKDGLF
ncbi:MAG: class II aldolase/adducin family protein [Bacteroidales bacterium]|nr:class II aldolase/adducin family protein [Candidatus Scybalousia scybalohippi]MCQ2327155.1 class II aldolase/adducin family protein [Bacteroidales bacterium]